MFTTNANRGAVSVCIRTVKDVSEETLDGQVCREDEVHVLLASGLEYVLPRLVMPLGAALVSAVEATRLLEGELQGRTRERYFHLVAPSPHVRVVVA